MFIVHGHKLVRKNLGFVGHFCPICRSLTIFGATQLNRVSHLYFMPLGGGTPFATELKCSSCHIILGFATDSVHPDHVLDPDLVEFAARTSPLGLEGLMDRLNAEARLTSNTLTAEDRAALITEPFNALEYFAQVQRQSGGDQSVTAVVCFFALVGFVATPTLWYAFTNPIPPGRTYLYWTLGVTAASVALLAWAVYRIVTDQKRVSRSRIVLDPLARALRPLRPDRAELDEVIAALHANQSMLGNGLDANTLSAAIEGPIQSRT